MKLKLCQICNCKFTEAGYLIKDKLVCRNCWSDYVKKVTSIYE